MESSAVRLTDFLVDPLNRMRVSEAFPDVCDPKFEATLGRLFDRCAGEICFRETGQLLVGALSLVPDNDSSWQTPALRNRKKPLLQAMAEKGKRLGTVVVDDSGAALAAGAVFWKLWGARQEQVGISWEEFTANPACAIFVSDTKLPENLQRACRQWGIAYIGELCLMQGHELARDGVGPVTIAQTKRWLHELGGLSVGTIVRGIPGEGGQHEWIRQIERQDALHDIYRRRLPEIRKILARLEKQREESAPPVLLPPVAIRQLGLNPKNPDDVALWRATLGLAGVELTGNAGKLPPPVLKAYKDLALQGLASLPKADGPA